MKSSRFAKTAAGILALALATLTLTGCTGQARWQKGTGPIKIVASTNVWGDIAYQIAGDQATVTALIDNVNQDPHSFEASTRDQLMVNKADLIIVNGGGYDAFLETMAAGDAANGRLINIASLVAMNSGSDNEHFWFSNKAVLTAADAIRDSLVEIEPASQAAFDAGHDEFVSDLKLLGEQMIGISDIKPDAQVLATEPLLDYLIAELGFTDKTPEAFKEAIEEETDAPLAAIAELEKLLKSGSIKVLFVNAQTASAQVDALVKVAQANNVPVVSVSEFQTEADQSYINFKSNVLLDIETALTTGESSAGDFD